MDLKKLQKVCNEVVYSFSIPVEIKEKFEKGFFLFEENRLQSSKESPSDKVSEEDLSESVREKKKDKNSKQKRDISVSSAAKTAETVQGAGKNKDLALKMLVLRNKQNSR